MRPDLFRSPRCAALISLAASLMADAQSPDNFNPGPNGPVYSLVQQSDGRVVVGGALNSLGGQTRYGIGRLEPDGKLDLSFNPNTSAATISCLAIQTNGQILVGGGFNFLGGQPRRNIGRLNSDGTLDPTFAPTVSNGVSCLVLQADGKILVGGSFTGIAGEVRKYIVRLNPNGSVDANFNPDADNLVYTLALQSDGRILAGGRFTSLGAGSGPYLARLDDSGLADSSFVPSPNNYVMTLAAQPDGKILVGGRFTFLGAQNCNYIGRLGNDGLPDATFNPSASGYVYSLVLQADGKILVGGAFTNLAGNVCHRIGRLNPDGSFDASFNPVASDNAYALGLQSDGKLVAGGVFSTVSGIARTNLARLNNPDATTENLTFGGSTVVWLRGGSSAEARRTSFSLTTNGIDWIDRGDGVRGGGGWQLGGQSFPPKAAVRARAYVSGGQYNGSTWHVESVAGFPHIVAQPISRTNIADTTASFTVKVVGSPSSYRWRKGVQPLTDTGNIFGSSTATLVLSNIFGGDAGNYSVVVSNSSGVVTSAVAVLTVIDPCITNQPVGVLVNSGQTAILNVGAVGTALRFQWRKHGSVLPTGTNSVLTITNIQWDDRGGYDVVVSNFFGSVTSTVATVAVNLATLDSFRPNPTNSISAMAQQPDGSLLLGGGFTSIAGQPRKFLGRFTPVGSLDPTFTPQIGGGFNSFPGVSAVTIWNDGKITMAGNFSLVDGVTRNYIARLRVDGVLDQSFSLSAYNWVNCLIQQPDGKLILGGGQPLARLETNGLAEAAFNPYVNGYLRSVALQSDGKILLGGYIVGLNSATVSNLCRLHADGSLDSNFVASANSDVNVLAVQADGKILVGGQFTMLCGQARNRFGRLNADGTLDQSFNPILDGVVPSAGIPNYAQPFISSIALQADGKIILSGLFTNLCGELRSCIGRLNPNGSLDETFNAWAGNLDARALALAIQSDGKVCVGGEFTKLAGDSVAGFGRLNNPDAATQSVTLDGSTLTWFRGGASPEVYATIFDYSTNGSSWQRLGAGTRIAGGWRIAGVSVPADATLRARGLVTGGYGNSSSWQVEATLGKPVITTQPSSRTNNAGTFASFTFTASGAMPLTYQWLKDGQPLTDNAQVSGVHLPSLAINNVLRFNAGNYSVIVSNSNGAVTSQVATLTVLDPVLINHPTNQLVNIGSNIVFGVTAAGTDLHFQWRRYGTNIPMAIGSSLALSNVQGIHAGYYDVVVSNSFGMVTSLPAMLTVNTVFADPLFGPSANAPVYSLAFQTDGRLLVAGEFTTLAGASRYRLGRMSTAGVLDSFAPNIGGTCMRLGIQPDNRILVGGYFFNINGQSRTRLGRLNSDGTLDQGFNPGAGNWLYGFTMQPDGRFLITSDPEKLRRFNFEGTLDGTFSAGIPQPAETAAMLPDGRYVVGPKAASFKAVYRLSSTGVVDPTFNVSLDGVNTSVSSIIVQPDGRLLIAGGFTAIGGFPRTNLARLNPDGSLDSSFRADSTDWGGVTSLALQTDGMILVGGTFNTVSGQPRTNLARLYPDGTLDPTFNPTPNGSVITLCLQPDGKILVGGNFDRLAGAVRNNLGRLGNLTATQTLTFDGADVVWMRSGAAPEVSSTTFAISTNGINWTDLGQGSRIPGGWRLSNVQATTNSTVRARGLVSGSQWSLEQTNAIGPSSPPKILSGVMNLSKRYALALRALPGQIIVIEASTNLASWTPVQTNFVTEARTFTFEDPLSSGFPRRFFRAKLYAGSLPPPAIRTSSASLSFHTNGFGFDLLGVPGTTLLIEASTNLLSWTPLLTNTMTGTTAVFADPSATNYSRRFYRARFP